MRVQGGASVFVILLSPSMLAMKSSVLLLLMRIGMKWLN
jgi:hypothetical protein